MHVLGGLVAHGAEMRVLELIASSARGKEFEHHVLVLDPALKKLELEFRDAGANIHFSKSVKHSGVDLVKTAKANRIDIVHSHVDLLNGWILAWANFAGVATRISHMRSEGVSTRQGRLTRARDLVLRRLISRNATHHVGVSPSALAAGYDVARARSKDARVIISGIDLARLGAESVRLPGGVVLVHVGRDTPIKNREKAAKVVEACRDRGVDAVLYFIGETTPHREQQLRESVDVDPSAIVFLGVRKDVPALVRGSDVLLSTSRAEGLPGTVLEAALVGTRVVASDIPATAYLSQLLDGIALVSLDSSNVEWFRAIERQVRAGEIRPVPMKKASVRQKFDSKQATENFEAFWKGTQGARTR